MPRFWFARLAGAAEGNMATGAHPAPARERVGRTGLWFGLFGAPAAWSVQTLADTAIAAHACYPRLTPTDEPVTGGMLAITLAVSAAALAVSIAALVVALRSWSRTRHEHQERSGGASAHGAEHALLETGEGRTRFMALSAVMMSVTFLVACLAHAASVLIVGACWR